MRHRGSEVRPSGALSFSGRSDRRSAPRPSYIPAVISTKAEKVAQYLLLTISIVTIVVRLIVGPRASWLVWVALGCTLAMLGLQKLTTNRRKQADPGREVRPNPSCRSL